jgi:hypothetical protein
MVSAGLLVLLYRRLDWTQFGQTLMGARWGFLVPIYLLFFANTAISAWKWRLLLAADGIRPGYRVLLATYWVGTFFNMFLPSSIGGDAYRIYDIARRSARSAEGVASVFADRLTGFLAISLWGVVFSLVGFSRLPERGIILLPAMVFLALTGGLATIFHPRGQRMVRRLFRIGRRPRVAAFFDRFIASLNLYGRNRRLLAQTLAISLVFQLLLIICIATVARMLGWETPFIYFCVFVPLITLMEALPVSIFGIGVRDAAYAIFFVPVGVSRENALALPMLYVALTALYASVGGIIFMWRRSPLARRSA